MKNKLFNCIHFFIKGKETYCCRYDESPCRCDKEKNGRCPKYKHNRIGVK
jgi:hypothetical protein